MVKRFNGSLMTTYPKPWISYYINDDDIVKIKITVTNVSTDIVYYDNHMPIAYKEIQTFFKDNKDIMYDYLFYWSHIIVTLCPIHLLHKSESFF